MNDTGSNSRIVYSTTHGSICPVCAKHFKNCACDKIKKPAVKETSGVLRLSYETKGRKGKGMTLIAGLALSREGILDLTRSLKQKLGTGGTVKDYIIELQGDHREQAALELRKLGYAVK